MLDVPESLHFTDLVRGSAGLAPTHASETAAASQFSATPTPIRASSIESLHVDSLILGQGYFPRNRAIQIPAAAAAEKLITGTITQMSMVRSRGTEILSPGQLSIQPDPSTTWNATIAETVASLLNYGKAYWLVLATDGQGTRERPDGLPVRCRVVDPMHVSVHYSTDIFKYDNIEKIYVGEHEVRRELVVIFDTGQPGVLRTGNTLFQHALDLMTAANRIASEPMPTGFLKNESAELGPEEAKAVIETWNESRRNNSTAFLQGLSYTPAAFSAEDLGLNDAMAEMATQIARVYNVPPALIATSSSGGSSLLYQNVSATYNQFLKQACGSIIRAIEQTLSSDLVTARGQQVAIDQQAFLRSDPTASADFAVSLLQAGVITPEEARSFMGLPEEGAPSPNRNLTPGELN